MQPSSTRRFSRAVLAVLAVIALAAAPPAIATTEETTTIGGIDAVVWTASGAGEQPVVVFSHGMHMCPTQSRS